MRNSVYLLFLFVIVSCSSNKSQNNYNPSGQTSNNTGGATGEVYYIESTPSFDNTNVEDNSEEATGFKYESRSGSSGNYEYNYDISGYDNNGNAVSGNIDIQGRYGSGTIEDQDGNQKSIDVEWVGNGELEGTDEDGNSYEFEVDD
jgi:FlaG/FlaF family flagellin (archaellin)